MKMKTLYKLPLVLAFVSGMALLSGCSGGSSSYSVYGGYGYPYYGNDWGYSSNYYYDDYDRREGLNQSERLERRDNIRQGASSRPTGSAAASRNMGRPSGGGGRMGGGGRGGGGRGGGGRR